MTANVGTQIGYGGAEFIAQPADYQVPVTGFSIVPIAGKTILNPAGTLATGTITMPATPFDGMMVKVSCTQIVTTLTVAANTGQSIVNAATAFTAGGRIGYIYRAADKTWYVDP
jgi:hypothetical protein